MVSNVVKLSSSTSPLFTSNIAEFTFRNVKRSYSGGYAFNFHDALSAVADAKTKNYTNFYLTDNKKLDQIIDVADTKLKSPAIYTSLQLNDKFIQFELADERTYSELGLYEEHLNYGIVNLTTTDDESTKFTISFHDGNICKIYHTINFKKYYLNVDGTDLEFVAEHLSPTNTEFKYLYSRSNKFLYLFYTSGATTYFIQDVRNNLELVETSFPNKNIVFSNPIKIKRDIYTDVSVNHNTTFIKYNDDNTINTTDIKRDLTNNFLLHREGETTDIIFLKNQMLQDDVFSSANALLSGNEPFYVNNLRVYTSIFHDMEQEKGEELALNYVFYNKPYTILPGDNTFITPDNMTPFLKLNINDTKFIDSGSFGYPTPIYADKVFYIGNANQVVTDNQYLLCTWLSGSPFTEEKVWVDRYYYPDLVSKAEALQGRTTFTVTYQNEIEQLIRNNITLQEGVEKIKYFDKISDMVFEPSQTYTYERLMGTGLTPQEASPITPCANSATKSLNYFRDINNKGKFNLNFYFFGDSSTWTVQSKRNDINAGLTITKGSGIVTFELRLYNPSINTIETFTANAPITVLKNNFINVSVDTLTGKGYFFQNNDIVLDFSFDIAKFYKKDILFGDFVVNGQDVLYSQDYIENPRVTAEFLPSELAFITPILDGKQTVDTIHITLPCGMRNSTDNINLLQGVCNSSTFKSGHINIHVKNTDLNDSIKTELTTLLTSTLDQIVPIGTTLNNIEFTTYK